MKIYLVVGWDGPAIFEAPQPSVFLSYSAAIERRNELNGGSQYGDFDVRQYEVADAPLPIPNSNDIQLYRPAPPVREVSDKELQEAITQAWVSWSAHQESMKALKSLVPGND